MLSSITSRPFKLLNLKCVFAFSLGHRGETSLFSLRRFPMGTKAATNDYSEGRLVVDC